MNLHRLNLLSTARALLTFSISLGIPLGIISCTPKQTPQVGRAATGQGPISELLSTRPQHSGPLKAIIKLSGLPLAKVATTERPEQLKLILKQQHELVTQLTALSSEIKVVFTYKYILNAIYIIVPEDLASQVDPLLPHGSLVEAATMFKRPEATVTKAVTSGSPGDIKAHNSVRFIGAQELHTQGLKGQGLKIGVIDTGIDFTHSMLGGSGKVEEFKKVNPAALTEQFPNAKVVGGFDFAGTEYDSASPDPLLRIPKPDGNPIDESGHGSHVAGTIAGIGDGVLSYTGVAPEALLFALKVFGKDGSTDDSVVMAALEFAADPDNNVETDDALDVVNLSLGSPFGTPKLLYKEAISNLNTIGTIIVASAGNSGDVSYITGSPAVNEEALSVAASVDDMHQNWHFSAAAFSLPNNEELLAETAEAAFTKPLESIEQTVAGKLVYIGKAAQVSEEQAAQLKGNIALIDRGEIAFTIKITNALKAGAIAAVVINNADGNPFTMGGDSEKLDIPAIMIGIIPGKKIREAVVKGEAEQFTVVANLKNDKTIAKPELIDTLTDFSSRGPRSEDSLIKPEISAPGSNIISAQVGGGTEVVQMSGTSMAAPHMSGVMALIKQAHKDLSPQELKSLAMLTAKSIKNDQGSTYPIALQGAGRIQVPATVKAGLTIVPASISLGRNEVQNSKTVVRAFEFKNLGTTDLILSLEPQMDVGLELVSPKTITIKANETASVKLQIKIKAPAESDFAHELDGFLIVKDQNQNSYSLPVLAIALKISNVTAGKLNIHSASAESSTGSLVELDLKNNSPNGGSALVFQLLGQDGRKSDQGFRKKGLSTACDLESVGYRTIKIPNEGQEIEVLQMALKLFNPLTTWHNCEFSVQIDADADGIADQELAGANKSNTEGLDAGMASLLLDANKARLLRKEFEAKVKAKEENLVLDFTDSLEEEMSLMNFDHSSLMIVQTPTSSLKTVAGQNLRVKVSALNLEQDTIETDDYLGLGWLELPLSVNAQTLIDIPEVVQVGSQETQQIQMSKGEGSAPVIIYYPFNHAAMTSAGDLQSQIVELNYFTK
jgi:subtilisin family serine protease